MTVAETAETNNDLYVAIFMRITTKLVNGPWKAPRDGDFIFRPPDRHVRLLRRFGRPYKPYAHRRRSARGNFVAAGVGVLCQRKCRALLRNGPRAKAQTPYDDGGCLCVRGSGRIALRSAYVIAGQILAWSFQRRRQAGMGPRQPFQQSQRTDDKLRRPGRTLAAYLPRRPARRLAPPVD